MKVKGLAVIIGRWFTTPEVVTNLELLRAGADSSGAVAGRETTG
jgi:hypothetical protein